MLQIKYAIRISKSETKSETNKIENREQSKTLNPNEVCLVYIFRSFEIASNFGFRQKNLVDNTCSMTTVKFAEEVDSNVRGNNVPRRDGSR